MPTNVSSLVTAEYTAVVPVFADTEPVNEAGFVAMMVPALNRTEFLRQNLPNLATQVSRVQSRIEEFGAVDWNNSRNVLHADLNWKTAFNGSPIVTGAAGATDNPSGVSVDLSVSGHSFAAFLGSQATSAPLRAAQIGRAAFIVQMPTTAANRDARYGFSQDANALNGGTHGLAFVQLETEANWQIKLKTSGGEDTIDTGVVIDEDDTYLLEIVRNSDGSFTMSIDEVEIGTYSSPTNEVITTETVNFGMLQIGKTAASRVFVTRHMSVRSATLGDRHGAA